MKEKNNMEPIYTITGTVVHGRVGKHVGTPTANIEVDEHATLPETGVYVAKILLDKKCRCSAFPWRLFPARKEKINKPEFLRANCSEKFRLIFSDSIDNFLKTSKKRTHLLENSPGNLKRVRPTPAKLVQTRAKPERYLPDRQKYL